MTLVRTPAHHGSTHAPVLDQVCYLGTATYDLPAPMAKQTSTLACRPGVRVVALNLATATPAPGVVDAALDRAHVVTKRKETEERIGTVATSRAA